jgi:hypothetical protein
MKAWAPSPRSASSFPDCSIHSSWGGWPKAGCWCSRRTVLPSSAIIEPDAYCLAGGAKVNGFHVAGISDTYALGVLAETTGLGLPAVVLPFVNTALASRAPFRRSVDSLRAEGVRILLGPGGFQPHPPRAGGNLPARSPGISASTKPNGRSIPQPGKHRRHPLVIAPKEHHFQYAI